MGEKEELNFLLLLGLFLRFARDYVGQPFSELQENVKCSCPQDLSDFFKQYNSSPRCNKHIGKVLLTLVKIKKTFLCDSEFAEFSFRITDAILFANDPKTRGSLVKELEQFLIDRRLKQGERDFFLGQYERWKAEARKNELFIEDDKERLKLSEDLKNWLGHSLKECKGVAAYSLGGSFWNLEIRYNCAEVTEHQILGFIDSLSHKNENDDLRKRNYFSDLLTFVPSTRNIVLNLESFPRIDILEENLYQTLGVFLKIKSSGQKLVTTVTHGKPFDGNTRFSTRTRSHSGHGEETIFLGPMWGYVYDHPHPNGSRTPNGPETSNNLGTQNGPRTHNSQGTVQYPGTSSGPRTPSGAGTSQGTTNGPRRLNVQEPQCGLGAPNDQTTPNGPNNCHPVEGFMDLCCIEVTEEQFAMLTREYGNCLMIDRIEPMFVTELCKRKVQKLGAATRMTFGEILYPNGTFKVLVNGFEVWLHDFIVTSCDTTRPCPQPAAEHVAGGSTEPGRISSNGDSGAIITTRPRDADQNIVDAISVHVGSYFDVYTNKRCSISFPLVPAIKKLGKQRNEELEFVKTCIPDFDKRLDNAENT